MSDDAELKAIIARDRRDRHMIAYHEADHVVAAIRLRLAGRDGFAIVHASKERMSYARFHVPPRSFTIIGRTMACEVLVPLCGEAAQRLYCRRYRRRFYGDETQGDLKLMTGLMASA